MRFRALSQHRFEATLYRANPRMPPCHAQSAPLKLYLPTCIHTAIHTWILLAQGLVEDLLRLPEGKLVSGKAKKAALKWLGGDAGDEASQQDAGASEGDEGSQPARQLLLVDADESAKTVSVMNEASGDVQDGVRVLDCALFAELHRRFEAGHEIKVLVRGGVVVGPVT
jgi:hypothetical protein